MHHDMDVRFATMATKDELHAVEIRLGLQIAGVSNQVEKSAAKLIQWSFVFWVGAVAAVALLAGVLRQ